MHIIKCNDISAVGYFRLGWAGLYSLDLPHNVSAAGMQFALLMMADDLKTDKENQTGREQSSVGNYLFEPLEAMVTFTAISSSSVHPGSDGNDAIFNIISSGKTTSGGYYDIFYTLWVREYMKSLYFRSMT